MTGKTESSEIKRILDETDSLIIEQKWLGCGPNPVIAESMRQKIAIDPPTLESYLRYTRKLTLSAPAALQ